MSHRKGTRKKFAPHTFQFVCVYESRHTRDLTQDQIMANAGEPIMCECGGPMFMKQAK